VEADVDLEVILRKLAESERYRFGSTFGPESARGVHCTAFRGAGGRKDIANF